ncbi:hypothetical protein LTR53_005525 [Teratosphaeriaceae sp. CCFEE 6253]|nr:hypothetical protein LTR53_005525 [Teratosphaeriaceae sp. CCFEE 6253]
MADADLIAYSVAAFICALFVLEYGADNFIDHTAEVAKRTGVPQTVIALLTAGAEWEELAVVIFALARHRPALALGNIVGSAISNILGAFSLGLLFHKASEGPVVFDRSAKLYMVLQLAVTGLVAGLLWFESRLRRKLAGGLLIALFAFYLVSVLWAIGKGRLAAPELSDSEDGDDTDSEEGSTDAPDHPNDERPSNGAYGTFGTGNNDTSHHSADQIVVKFQGNSLRPTSSSPSRSSSVVSDRAEIAPSHSPSHHSSAPLLAARQLPQHPNPNQRGLAYHLTGLVLGFLALTLSAYVLSHTAITLVTQLGISEALFGVVILAIATTLPEKFVAVVGGRRGQTGIVVANTAGSNIFLLTLCLGIFWLSTEEDTEGRSVNGVEIAVMLASSLFMTLSVCIGGRRVRYVGGIMLAAYAAFVVVEFALIRRPHAPPP